MCSCSWERWRGEREERRGEKWERKKRKRKWGLFFLPVFVRFRLGILLYWLYLDSLWFDSQLTRIALFFWFQSDFAIALVCSTWSVTWYPWLSGDVVYFDFVSRLIVTTSSPRLMSYSWYLQKDLVFIHSYTHTLILCTSVNFKNTCPSPSITRLWVWRGTLLSHKRSFAIELSFMAGSGVYMRIALELYLGSIIESHMIKTSCNSEISHWAFTQVKFSLH